MSARQRAWFDQAEEFTKSMVRKHGWAIEYISGGACCSPGRDGDEDGPAFAYTVGLFGLGHPELLVFGLDQHDTAGLLNTLGTMIRDDEVTLIPGELLTFDEWDHRVVTEEVPNPGEIVFTANRFYRRPDRYSVPVLQLTYDDINGRFPWDEGYLDTGHQPRAGTFRA